MNTNFGITAKKELASAEITILVAEETGDLEEPNTARQLEREEESPRSNSSVVERDQMEAGSTARPLPSPLSAEGPNNPILTRLSPLLAREWMRRHLLE